MNPTKTHLGLCSCPKKLENKIIIIPLIIKKSLFFCHKPAPPYSIKTPIFEGVCYFPHIRGENKCSCRQEDDKNEIFKKSHQSIYIETVTMYE